MAQRDRPRAVTSCAHPGEDGIRAANPGRRQIGPEKIRSSVLIVDDEQAMRDSCALVLEREGYEVATVCDGKAALDALRHRGPDVVIIDLKMPGMSGEEFLSHARETDPDVVAIAITGYATLSSAVGAMRAGAYDFLPKPFRAEELRLIVRRAVERRKLSLAAGEAEREKRRMRDYFVAMVSHQLKSPAASLKECLDAILAQAGAKLPEECRELLLHADAKAELLLRLMDDWLTLSRLESGGIRPAAGTVDVRAVVERAVARVKEAAANRQVAVELQPDKEPLQVQGDADALCELVVNLVDNAVRYTPDGGRVVVRASGEAGGALIAVEDNGPGIPPDELGLIFEPFFRGAEAKKQPGTGLGLAIVKQIVEAHGGHITVQSDPSRGTTFEVYLPPSREDA